MIILTLFLFGFQVSATDKLQIVRSVTVAKQAECKLLLGHLYSKLHIQLGNFEPRISTVGAKRSLSVEVDRKEMVLRTVSSYKLELIKRQVSYCTAVLCVAMHHYFQQGPVSFHTLSAELLAKSGCRRLLQNLIKVCNKIESSADIGGLHLLQFASVGSWIT